MLCTLLIDAARFLRRCLRRPMALAAENLGSPGIPVVNHKAS